MYILESSLFDEISALVMMKIFSILHIHLIYPI